jgi:hypothetical protein
VIGKTEEGIVWPSCKFSVAFCLTRLIATSKLPVTGNFHRDATNAPGYLDESLILEKKNIMRTLIAISAMLGLCFSVTSPAKASWVYNANSEFREFERISSGNQLPTFGSGHFSAGYSGNLSGSFSPFSNTDHKDDFGGNNLVQGWRAEGTSEVPAVVVNTSNSPALFPSFSSISSLDPDQILLHAGVSNGNAILRFTASITSSYFISGDWESLDSGGTTNLIRKFGESGFLVLDSSTANNSAFMLTTFLSVGESIDFIVNSGDSISFDATGLRATITAVPEPTTLALFGLGGVGLAIAKRRRTRKVAS